MGNAQALRRKRVFGVAEGQKQIHVDAFKYASLSKPVCMRTSRRSSGERTQAGLLLPFRVKATGRCLLRSSPCLYIDIDNGEIAIHRPSKAMARGFILREMVPKKAQRRVKIPVYQRLLNNEFTNVASNKCTKQAALTYILHDNPVFLSVPPNSPYHAQIQAIADAALPPTPLIHCPQSYIGLGLPGEIPLPPKPRNV
jgi:hypothetical protein